MGVSPSAIGDALFTKTQQKILGLLYGSPDRSFYLNEVVRFADMGRGTIQRELNKLASVGLVTDSKQGNQTHFQANIANPVFNELKGLVDKTFGIVGTISAALSPSQTKIAWAFVYGSVAKGDEHAGSDIDLMLVSDFLGYSDVMNLLIEAEQQAGRRINPTLYTSAEFENRILNGHSFLTKVVAQNILWVHGESAFYQQFSTHSDGD